MALIPADASVAADTPLLPLLAKREAAIRFPRHVQYRDREGRVQPVEWVVALPGYYAPLAPVFKGSRNKQQRIQRELRKLKAKFSTFAIVAITGRSIIQLELRKSFIIV